MFCTGFNAESGEDELSRIVSVCREHNLDCQIPQSEEQDVADGGLTDAARRKIFGALAPRRHTASKGLRIHSEGDALGLAGSWHSDHNFSTAMLVDSPWMMAGEYIATAFVWRG